MWTFRWRGDFVCMCMCRAHSELKYILNIHEFCGKMGYAWLYKVRLTLLRRNTVSSWIAREAEVEAIHCHKV